jgi:hypothetical protein
VISPVYCEENKTMVHPKAQRVALSAVRTVEQRKVPGDIVEVGVWMGGMSCKMALEHLRVAASQATRAHRRVWLFDTFQGLSKPTAEDGVKAVDLYNMITNGSRPKGTGDDPLRWNRDNKWNYGPLDEVRMTMAASNFPQHQVHFVVGPAEETLRIGAGAAIRAGNDTTQRHRAAHSDDGSYGHTYGLNPEDVEPMLPKQIAILRLDTDWYASTKVELDILWSRLQPGGWLAVDDYYTWGGAKKAVDEWLLQRNWTNAAHKQKAFGPSCCNNLFKSNPYDEERPFGVWNP